jgi:hypothetical protein
VQIFAGNAEGAINLLESDKQIRLRLLIRFLLPSSALFFPLLWRREAEFIINAFQALMAKKFNYTKFYGIH